jgi:hypothetical protein
MYSAFRRIRAAIVFLAVCTTSADIAAPQTAKFSGHSGDPFLLVNLPLAANPCAKNPGSTYVAPSSASAAVGDTPSVCDEARTVVPAVNPCNTTSAVRTGCEIPKDVVQADLDAMGGAGRKIARAREKVLEILQSENACKAWFQEKDPNPAATFRSLNYELDRKGDELILESRDVGDLIIYRNPYVAKVYQGDGANATVTLNVHGAFFHSDARVVELRREGGPIIMRGLRMTNVGQYAGNTLPAQVLALLHEFGHVLNLLPEDFQNVGGKSVQNTNEVLRYCRSEVESKVRRSALSASR